MGAGERSEAYRKRPAACARTPRAYTQPSRAPAHKLEIPPAAGQIQSAPGRHQEVRRSCPLQRKATSFSPAWMERVWTVDIHCVPEQLAKTHLSRSSMLIARRMEGRWEPTAAQSADFGSYLPSSSSKLRSAATGTRSSASYAKTMLRSTPWAFRTSSCARAPNRLRGVALRRVGGRR